MKRPRIQISRKQEGQALVEFALVSLLLFTLLIGITDFARLYFTYSSLSNAAREGARYGIINPYDTDGIMARAEALLINFGDNTEIQISFPDGSRQMGARIRVRVSGDFRLLMLPIPPFNVVADSTMRIETTP